MLPIYESTKSKKRIFETDIASISHSIEEIRKKVVEKLKAKAKEIRKKTIEMIANAKSGHIGGCFSVCDLLIGLYYYKMRINPKNPRWNQRDRLILSKGHSVPVLYAILEDLGYFKIKSTEKLRQINSRLQGHPCMNITPGIDMSSGSLGMGLSAGCGMAIASKLDNLHYNVYVILGDGEMQEGQAWESIMTASHMKLGNLIAIIDKNNLQTDMAVKSVKNSGNFSEQFNSFGWNVYTINGHDFYQIVKTFDLIQQNNKKPTVIIAETCKGKGVKLMENNPYFHGAIIIDKFEKIALNELELKE
ncbi:transketolase [Candidatus Harpocratesius sp.]